MHLLHLKPNHKLPLPPLYKPHYHPSHFLKPKPIHLILPSTNKPFSSLKPLNSSPRSRSPGEPKTPNPNRFDSLSKASPILLSQPGPILLGWLFSLLSVFSLSRIIPRVGRLSLSVSVPTQVVADVLALSGLLLAKVFGSYGQQATLSAAFRIRVFVFRSALDMELGLFEGEAAVPPGDIAYRITAEAANVAETLYALLNLTAMAAQLLAISPAISAISLLVIPFVALASALLGERLKNISNKAHVSIASLSAYLNEVASLSAYFNEVPQLCDFDYILLGFLQTILEFKCQTSKLFFK